uniref:DUF4218 domain-containing protein n=1 Tax=Tanacetum cinerariifolium TaxID=118510 RepID=A0A6L2LXD8_TANCI|nr:hypothetical protein [Tanacetum cinerariifolium]
MNYAGRFTESPNKQYVEGEICFVELIDNGEFKIELVDTVLSWLDHISKYGFEPSYKTRIHQGEPDLPLPPPIIDNTRQSQISDMTACLNDHSHIPLDNEQNEPTQGDIGEVSKDPTQAKHNKFKELYTSANEELYPGCDYLTRLDFMQYLASDVAKPLTELCLIFKQICSQTLMVDDMLKAQSKMIDILCNLELIYPPPFFDIMIHLVIHLPLEDIFGGPIRPWLIYLFERYMKKLKNYIRNKAKPDGSIAKGYVAEKALTIGSHYFRDVTTKFNRPDRNVDCPPPTYQRQIRQHHVNNDPCVIKSSELFALACGQLWTPISVKSYVVNSVRFVVHSRDERRITQNSGICSPGPNGEMYYGRFQNFVIRNNITRIKANGEALKNDHYILATQVKQCFYLKDMARRPLGWKVVEHVSHKKFSNRGVIVLEDDPDVTHVDNSFDLALSTSLNDLKITALNIDGQSIEVDSPPNIIDVVDEGDDIIDQEDPIPHDLAGFDDDDLVNLDINMSADVVWSHGSDGGSDDRPLHISKGTQKPNLGGRRAGRLHTRQETRNLSLKAIMDKRGPVPIRFEVDDRETSCLSVTMWLIGPTTSGSSLAALQERYWVSEEDESYVLERIRCRHPSHISEVDWDEHLAFWNDFKNLARAAKNKQNWAKSKDEMLRLQGLGSNTLTGVPCTKDEIMAVMLTQLESQPEYGGGNGSGGCGDDEPRDDEDGGEDEEDKDDS